MPGRHSAQVPKNFRSELAELDSELHRRGSGREGRRFLGYLSGYSMDRWCYVSPKILEPAGDLNLGHFQIVFWEGVRRLGGLAFSGSLTIHQPCPDLSANEIGDTHFRWATQRIYDYDCPSWPLQPILYTQNRLITCVAGDDAITRGQEWTECTASPGTLDARDYGDLLEELACRLTYGNDRFILGEDR
jgi:hypothetical protein